MKNLSFCKSYLPFVILISFLLTSCGDPVYNSTLDKKRDFIAGVITPKGVRDYKTEIFVGVIAPTDHPPIPLLGFDQILNRILLTLRANYYTQMTGYTNASVKITDESGKSVNLVHVGNGFYQDTLNELDVKYNKTYKLFVSCNGHNYTATTTVPDELKVSNAKDNDTIKAKLYHPTTYDRWLWYPELAPHKKPMLYRLNSFIKGHDGFSTDQSFIWDCGLATTDLDNNDNPVGKGDVLIAAIDSNYGRIYHPGTDWSGSDEWFSWYMKNKDESLPNRSSIQGGNGVVGAFGSCSQVRVNNLTYVRGN